MIMKRLLSAAVAVVAGLVLLGAPAPAAVTPTYGDYSMMFVRTWGLYGPTGQFEWAWSPQSATESRITWGNAWNTPTNPNPPSYNEQFVRSGDWVTLPGWFDNGTFYAVRVDTEWQAAADCRTGRTMLPTGGPQHYVRWAIPSASYCLYAEGTVTEQSSGHSFRFIHQQVWSTAATCPRPASGATDYICQWESWADANGTPLAVKVERTGWLSRGRGPAQQIIQTAPTPWSATVYATGTW